MENEPKLIQKVDELTEKFAETLLHVMRVGDHNQKLAACGIFVDFVKAAV